MLIFVFHFYYVHYYEHQVAMVEEEEEGITTHHEIHQLLNMNQVEDGVVVEDMYPEEGKSVLLNISISWLFRTNYLLMFINI